MKQNKSLKMLPVSMKTVLRAVGKDIQTARKRRGLTQARLAELAKTSRDTIRRIEAGDPAVAWGIVLHVLWAMQLDHAFTGMCDPGQDEYGLARAKRTLPQRVRTASDDENKYDF